MSALRITATLCLLLVWCLVSFADNRCPGLPQCICNKQRTSINCNGKHLKFVPKFPKTVEKLFLENNDLTNISTQAFFGLSNLEMLYLDHNKISAIEPFAFDSLINLNYIDLRSNKLLSLGNYSLSNMPQLKTLHLETNSIRTVAESAFNGTSSLEYVNMQSNKLSFVPQIGHQPYLSQLILDSNNITDAKFPSSYTTCSHNTDIVLSKNKIKRISNSSFEHLAGSSLSKLFLSSNAISIIEPGSFSWLYSVVSLRLGWNSLNSRTLKNAVAGLADKDVESLDVSGIGLNDGLLMADTFSLLKNTTLLSLIMRFNKIRIIHDNTFLQLNTLTMLDLSNNAIHMISENGFTGLFQLSTLKLTDNHLRTIPTNLPTSLNFLYLEKNQIATITSGVFNSLANLWDLRINRNVIRTLEKKSFSGLTNLKRLELNHNIINPLPGGVFSSLTRLLYLDLSNNNLNIIQKSTDRFSSLAALEYLNLADNQCSFIQSDALHRMVSLKVLHLEGNRLGKLFSDSEGTFLQESKKLEELYIMNNNITYLSEFALKNQYSLVYLNASHNGLTTWGQNFFKSTQKITTLDFSYNSITSIDKEQMRDLTNLKSMDLTKSPFICNCDLRWFRDWINQTDTILLNVASYTCGGPKQWKGKPLLDFRGNKIICWFFTTYAIVGAAAGTLLISLFLVCAIYKNRWRLSLACYKLSRRGRHFFKKLKPSTGRNNYGAIPRQDFDAYVSCSEPDRPWALKHLLPGIDNGQLNDERKFEGDFRLYYEDRDSEPGAAKVANVVENMARSSKVIIILSRNYFTGMTEFELDQATIGLQEREIEDIIVVKLGDVPVKMVPKQLYRQMRTGLFLEWEDDENAKLTFREKLIDRLRKKPQNKD